MNLFIFHEPLPMPSVNNCFNNHSLTDHGTTSEDIDHLIEDLKEVLVSRMFKPRVDDVNLFH